jgi:predicted NAD-dependent protein-ADP-ribosyltransferase YbiA (DUF1768 family)
MMHQKALLFNDTQTAAKILKAGLHPRKVKALGRAVENFDEKIWNENRGRIVREGSMAKFTLAVSEEGLRLGSGENGDLIGMSLRDLLLSTGDRELVEASPYDSIWGVGFAPGTAAQNREHWGLNLLGIALMETRALLREDKYKERSQQENLDAKGA